MVGFLIFYNDFTIIRFYKSHQKCAKFDKTPYEG